MDEDGDAEGNYTLIARKTLSGKTEQFGLFPVGIFALPRTAFRLPVSRYLLFAPDLCRFKMDSQDWSYLIISKILYTGSLAHR